MLLNSEYLLFYKSFIDSMEHNTPKKISENVESQCGTTKFFLKCCNNIKSKVRWEKAVGVRTQNLVRMGKEGRERKGYWFKKGTIPVEVNMATLIYNIGASVLLYF